MMAFEELGEARDFAIQDGELAIDLLDLEFEGAGFVRCESRYPPIQPLRRHSPTLPGVTPA